MLGAGDISPGQSGLHRIFDNPTESHPTDITQQLSDRALNRAALEIHFRNCEAGLLEDENTRNNEEWSIKQVRKSSSGRSTMRNVNVSLDTMVETSSKQTIASAGGAFKGEGGIGMSTNSQTEALAERNAGNWSLNSGTGLIVGTHSQPLSGTEVDRFKGWRVKPKPNSDVLAVVAILSTRADWINFSDVDDDSLSGRIGRRAKKLFRSRKQEKKEYFNLLLKTLAEKGLSASENKRDAILAVAVQVLRTNSELDSDCSPVAVILENQRPSRKIDIDSQSIDHFLNLNDGEEVKFLKELGVSESAVIPPFLTGLGGRIHAAIFSFCAGVMPPMPILGRSLL